MNSKPTFEGIKQAILASDTRLKIGRCNENYPENRIKYWIKKICIENSEINLEKKLEIDFNPQLNTIIGGRGSGKSSIIKILNGGLGCENIAKEYGEKENDDFYKEKNKKNGIFNKDTKIAFYLVKDNIEYRVNISNIKNENDQKIEIYKIDNGNEELIQDDGFINFFKLQIYMQKQIYNIASDENVILNIIDMAILDMERAKIEKEEVEKNLLNKYNDKRELLKYIDNKDKKNTEVKYCEAKIKSYNNSGIKNIIEQKMLYVEEEKILEDIKRNVSDFFNNIKMHLKNDINDKMIQEINNNELKNIINEYIEKCMTYISSIEKCIIDANNDFDSYEKKINDSMWSANKMKCNEEYENKKNELYNSGINIDDIDNLLIEYKKLKKDLTEIQEKENEFNLREKEIEDLKIKLNEKNSKISNLRVDFINNILKNDDNIKMQIRKGSNQRLFVKKMMNLIGSDSKNFEKELYKISQEIFDNKRGIEYFRDIIENIKKDIHIDAVSAWFVNSIKRLQDEVIDKMLIYELEDELEVQYKSDGDGGKYKSLLNASSGQKAATILRFILSYGETPLLLDQPEDDLDNKLVFNFVVKTLKKIKEYRQLIVVTHNANIPVNSDAEYIIAMNSSKNYIEVEKAGTIDDKDVRDEICDIMEGTEDAFKRRAKKYYLNGNW